MAKVLHLPFGLSGQRLWKQANVQWDSSVDHTELLIRL